MKAFGVLGVGVYLSGLLAFGQTLPYGEAPKKDQLPGRWSSGIKQAVGTAYEAYDSHNRYSPESRTAPISRVWFTVSQGILTEVFWPTVDTPQIRDSQFLVSDGQSFFFEERKDAVSEVTWTEHGVPAFRVINKDPKGRFQIEKTIYTDPDRDAVIQRVRIQKFISGLHFYYLHNPQVGNTPMGNSAKVDVDGLYAWQDEEAQALHFTVPLLQVSAGFSGPSDGFHDLYQDFRMDWHYRYAYRGNVVTTAELNLSENETTHEFYIALGFAKDVQTASLIAKAALVSPQDAQAKYESQWRDYQSDLLDLSPQTTDGGTLYRSSIAVVKSLEDKTHEGAFIASPSVPWGQHVTDINSTKIGHENRIHTTGGYHLIWPRDLYHMANTFLAVGDPKSAVASLQFLKSVQVKSTDEWVFGKRRRAKLGTFPQNCWVDGESHWVNLQMDEVAYPVILIHKLWKRGLINLADYWPMARDAADFIQGFGPWSPQERWEEIFGASPSTIAAEISALWAASLIAGEMGDVTRARSYQWSADGWAYKEGDNVTNWTFTETGKYGNGRYFIRIEAANHFDQVWNPSDDAFFNLANGVGPVMEKNILDGGFLDLVRMGVRPALSGDIVDTIPEYDATIRRDLPGFGPGFYRYLGDRYNYEDATGLQTNGMVWPLLTGERGHYEMQKAVEEGKDGVAAIRPYMIAMEKMATPSFMLPEQVWDSGSRMGQSTGAATPLGWAHGEYIKALRSIRDGSVFDRVAY